MDIRHEQKNKENDSNGIVRDEKISVTWKEVSSEKLVTALKVLAIVSHLKTRPLRYGVENSHCIFHVNTLQCFFSPENWEKLLSKYGTVEKLDDTRVSFVPFKDEMRINHLFQATKKVCSQYGKDFDRKVVKAEAALRRVHVKLNGKSQNSKSFAKLTLLSPDFPVDFGRFSK
jgi:hypothetical protein